MTTGRKDKTEFISVVLNFEIDHVKLVVAKGSVNTYPEDIGNQVATWRFTDIVRVLNSVDFGQ